MTYSIHPNTRSGLSIFLAGSVFSCMAKKYSSLGGCSMKIKMGAFAVAGFAKAYIPNYFEHDNRINFDLRNFFITLILIGSATKCCKFEGAFLKKTAVIAIGYFGTSHLLGYCFYERLSSKEFTQRYKQGTLPFNGIAIKETLDIKDYFFISHHFPKIRVVMGDLNIEEFIMITSLPDESLLVEGNLTIKHCLYLESLSSGLCVKGNLDLQDLTTPPTSEFGHIIYFDALHHAMSMADDKVLDMELKSLPEDLIVEGKLLLSSSQFKKLLINGSPFPKAPIYISGDVDLSGWTSLTSLPEKLHVDGDLILRCCRALDSLPQVLHVDGKLVLEDCTSLTSLPEELHVDGDLILRSCWALDSFPQVLHVEGKLVLEACTNLSFLPDQLYINPSHAIYLNRCTSLTYLPEGFSHGGSLSLEGCTSLTYLPEGIHIGGFLSLRNCTGLLSLPEELHVGGDLDLNNCSSLTSLPTYITELGPRSHDGFSRSVNLEGTGLSDAIVDRLRNAPAPGIHFHFGRQATTIDERTFNRIDRALKFWGDIVRRDPPQIILEKTALEYMTCFLSRLVNTAEYKNIQTRNILALRVLEMVDFLNDNEEIKGRAIDLIHDGLTSCDDRVIATLDDVELLGKIHSAEIGSPSQESEKKLRGLGIAIFKLEEVRKYARIHMASLLWVDEVEVQLAFQIGLKNSLSLPLSTQNMLFRGCSNVSNDDIETVRQRVIQECTEERLEQFFKSWDPWIRHLRRKALPKYEELLLNPKPLEGPVQCEILYAKTSHPVQHGQNVFDYDTLCKIYVDKGKNPCTNMAIDWEDVRRIHVLPSN